MQRIFHHLSNFSLVFSSSFHKIRQHQRRTKMSLARYFKNPYPDFEKLEDPEKFTIDAVKLKKQGLDLIEQVYTKGLQSGDGGLYVGAVGYTYMMLHCQHQLSNEEKAHFIGLAQSSLQAQFEYIHAHHTPRADFPAFLLGRAGTYAVTAGLGKMIDRQEMVDWGLKGYRESAHICKPIAYVTSGCDELFVGRAGYLCGALWLQKQLGYQPIPETDLEDIWKAIILSGKDYASKRAGYPCPLMYSYYDTLYLGAAHGLSSIMQILLCFPKFLKADPEAEKLIKDTIDYYLTLQDASGNFPCAMDEIKRKRSSNDALVHWCHGAPGAVYMFAKAYLYFKDPKYLEACIRCGECVWNYGLLRKGPGICHGVAGNGYTFLVIYNLLEQKDKKHLYRAAKFADFLSDPTFIEQARKPDRPFSLYEGLAGTACYVMDLLQPEKAHFPFFDLYTDYN